MKNKKAKFSIWTFICIILIILNVLQIIFHSTIELINVNGSSMYETLCDGDNILVGKYKKAKRGDIIVVEVSRYREQHFFNSTTQYIIKRLIAIEGDTIYCENSTLYIRYADSEEFVALVEDYVSSRTPDFTEVTVGKGEIFVLGDNRDISRDSSEVGCLLKEDIYGTLIPYSMEHPWTVKLFKGDIWSIFSKTRTTTTP